MRCPKCNTNNSKDAIFCHICGTKLIPTSKTGTNDIDNAILDIIKQNSYSKRPLAAYDGRKYAERLCYKHFGKDKKNYKEYVEMLMYIHYPKELEKAILGKKYLFWRNFSLVLMLTIYGIPISIFTLIWKAIPTYKKIKLMCI